MRFKILKKGNSFVAYDIDSKDKKDLGRISITTKKFVGNTVCLKSLTRHLDEYLKEQLDEVLSANNIEFISCPSSYGFIGTLKFKHGTISVYNRTFYVKGEVIPINIATLDLIQQVQDLYHNYN